MLQLVFHSPDFTLPFKQLFQLGQHVQPIVRQINLCRERCVNIIQHRLGHNSHPYLPALDEFLNDDQVVGLERFVQRCLQLILCLDV